MLSLANRNDRNDYDNMRIMINDAIINRSKTRYIAFHCAYFIQRGRGRKLGRNGVFKPHLSI